MIPRVTLTGAIARGSPSTGWNFFALPSPGQGITAAQTDTGQIRLTHKLESCPYLRVVKQRE